MLLGVLVFGVSIVLAHGDITPLGNDYEEREYEIEFEYGDIRIESDTADYSACNIRFCEDGTIFDVKKSGEPYLFELFVPIIGLHGALDSAFAVALADINGVDGQKIRDGLLRYKSIENRQNIIEKNGVILMADCYNFGPESARASLEAFEILEKRKNAAKTVVVFGSMLELGEISESEHISLGKRLAAYKFDALLTLGSEARDIAKGARLAQMNESSIFSFSEDEREQAGKMLENLLCENCAVLLKGSRKMKMEEFIPIILCKK
jgi:UDP-N-acetylmuramoyl-tripeptide--D-alanyl-D-alanine ligase